MVEKFFEGLGKFVVRFRWLVVLFWIIAAIVIVKNFPTLSSVTQDNSSTFLPTNTPSSKAAGLAVPFEGKGTTTTATLVAVTTSGQLTPQDNAAITNMENQIKKVSSVSIVEDEGISKDNEARQAIIGLNKSSYGQTAVNLVNQLRSVIKANNVPGLQVHLTGTLAELVDEQSQSNSNDNSVQMYSIIFIILLLLFVYRSLLAPLITLIPAAFSLVLAQPVIAEAAKHGVQVSPVTQIILIVLILGAGTDYGIFLVFRVREELRHGLEPKEAIVRALSRVGVSITFSGFTVIAALLSLMLASFGLYKGLGPALAIGLGVMLVVALTLLPALLAIFGRLAFWPSHVKGGEKTIGFWGSFANRVIKRPVLMLSIGIIIFGGLSFGLLGYRTTGFAASTTAPSSSDSGQGAAVISKHFSSSINNPDNVFLKFNYSVWNNLSVVAKAQKQLAALPYFKAIDGPFNYLTVSELSTLHKELGNAQSLPTEPPPGLNINPQIYQLYRGTIQFISPDGSTVQYYGLLSTGSSGSTSAMDSTPAIRDAITKVANNVGASDNGYYGLDPVAYDISHVATSDLKKIFPVVLMIIAILLAILLRSFVAPLYLIVTVAFSYLASLGFAMIIFVHIGGEEGLNFILPFLMFVFSMALGEDYNILVMSRIREEAHETPTLKQAVSKAIGFSGTTVTSAGLILAGTFTVLAVAGGAGGGGQQIQQIGLGIAFGVLLDTLFVRTVLVPSIVVLLGKWNWWPSKLYQIHHERTLAESK